MNIQFSLSSGSVPAKSGGELTAKSSENLSGVISVSRGSKDISEFEQQGGQLPRGQEELIKRIEKAVKSLEGPQTTLDISIHEKTHQIMVKVLNKETGELIREVPNEKTLDLVAKMMELAGAIVDERI